MHEAARRGDPTKRLIPMDEWLVHHRSATPYCRVCGSDLSLSGERSTKVVTHFVHAQGANCPLSQAGGRAFERFHDTERASESEARAIKQYTLDHIESIYERARALCPGLSWNEFLPLLTKADEYRLWALKGLNPGYLPYLLLCCAERFNANKAVRRVHTIFFVLEPGASDAEFWHLLAAEKQVIWRVETTNPLLVTPIRMTTGEVTPWYRENAQRRLKL